MPPTVNPRAVIATVIAGLVAILKELRDLESQMSDLSLSVEELRAAVDAAAARFSQPFSELQAALAAANQAAADAQAGQAGAEAARDAALADAAQAANDIRVEIGRLNALGSDPSTPIDTNPPEEVPPPDVIVPDPLPDVPPVEIPAGDQSEGPVVNPL